MVKMDILVQVVVGKEEQELHVGLCVVGVVEYCTVYSVCSMSGQVRASGVLL